MVNEMIHQMPPEMTKRKMGIRKARTIRLEAAAWGVPAVAGPHMFNFAAIAETLEEAGAMIRLPEPGQLAACLGELLADAERRLAMGEAGRRVVAHNRGATEKLLELVAGVLAEKKSGTDPDCSG